MLTIRQSTLEDIHLFSASVEFYRKEKLDFANAQDLENIADWFLDTEKTYLTILNESEVIGFSIFRYNERVLKGEIQLFLLPDFRQKRLGLQALLGSELFLMRKYPKLRVFCAHIGETNQASIKIFSGAGYFNDVWEWRKLVLVR